MRAACIGVGTVGRAWAALLARGGHEVALWDGQEGTVAAALPRIRDTLALLEDGDAVDAAMARLRPAATLEDAVADADLVQESVREDLSVKRAVLAEVGRHAPEGALVASSTSALPPSAFLTGLAHPERALVAHPVNPPSLIPLVELCPSPLTDPATMERARALYEGLGMAPVTLSREIDGFLLNRLQYTLVAEAMHLVGEGYCSPEDIDRVMTEGLALRWLSIGPFMTAHLNAAGGFAGFVAQLGPMMRRMGEDARTAYPWTEAQVAAIHEAMAAQVPVARIPERQAWRDGRILAARRLQGEG